MTKKWLLAMAFLALVALTAAPAGAQEPGGFSESFDTPQLEEWERSPEVVVTNGTLRIGPGNFALRFGDWRNPTIEARLRYTTPGEVLLHYAFHDDTHYVVHLFEEMVLLERVQQGAPTELGQAASAAVGSGDWIDLRIVVSDGEHEISVDGEALITATDPNPLPPGAILFHAAGEAVLEIDELAVSGQAVEPRPPVPEEPPVAAQPTPVGGTPVPTDGGARSLVEAFFSGQGDNTDLLTFVINLALAAVTSYVLGRVYIHWGSSLSNRRRFAANFMLITMTTTFIILVVRSSVALSLGLVGALSIVRFRTAVKEPEELAYLFFAIALGIGFGDNQRLITLLALAAAIAILGLVRLLRHSDADVNLHLTVASRSPRKVDLEEITSTLEPHCAKLKLLRFDENQETLEAAFLVEFNRMSNLGQAKAALRGLSDGVEITFMDNRGIW